jgi:DDE superfamily endonuclease
MKTEPCLPACNIQAMNLHRAEISPEVAPGRHAVLLLDPAEWYMSARLRVAANITLLALPPKCPELNPAQNIWQFIRDNWLSDRIIKSYEDTLDHCYCARRTLVVQPWRIMSIGLRGWTHALCSMGVGITHVPDRRGDPSRPALCK